MQTKRKFQLQLFSIPFFYFVTFTILPLYGITLAFKEFSYTKGLFSPWSGLKNFYYLIFEDPNFTEVLQNTMQIGMIRSVLLFLIPLMLVFLINKIQNKQLQSWFLLVMLFPQFLSWVVVAGIFRNLFSLDGLINHWLITAGVMSEPVSFLTDSGIFLIILFIAIVWKEVGFYTYLYHIALSTIEPSIYEAAVLDGAGEMALIFHIKLPMIKRQLMLVTFLILITFTSGAFEAVFNLYNASVYHVADIIDTYIYRTGISNGKFSMGAAIDLLKNCINLIIIVLLSLLTNKQRSDFDEELFV